MKTIGLIGGLSWESTAHYYTLLNELVHAHLGGQHSARLVIWSVDFAEIEELQRAGDWAKQGEILAEAAARLERAGAEILLIGANTMHEPAVVSAVESRTSIPLLHIADTVAAAAKADGVRTIGLLGTAYVMERPFYRERLEAHGMDVIVPDETDRATIHRIIFDELTHGIIRDESRASFVAVATRLVERGAEAIALSCTEFGLLVSPGDLPVRSYDSTELHAQTAAEIALGLRSLPAAPHTQTATHSQAAPR